MLERLIRFARILSLRSDLVLAVIILTAVVMMIIPLPTMLVDIIITFNITIGLLILLVGFYITSPMQFSSLPAVILIATVFRLAITITTTRLILLHADAGSVVRTFGDFVIGGNVAVGLVIFFIITIAQFVVITKGGERVAEVAARFSLDALPGKQMAIDNELRNGDITQLEARVLRRGLERESHLFGAMDGAMKFVKGDAIAGLVIIVVNLIGGLAVGMAQKGMSFSDAMHIYSLLTVGDGLVAQIPALLVSLGAATVVTRVASDERKDLGSDITSQIIADPRVLYLSGGILLGLSFIPGFPVYVFLTLAAALFGGGFLLDKRKRELGDAAEAGEGSAAVPLQAKDGKAGADGAQPARKALPGHGVLIRVGAKLDKAIQGDGFAGNIDAVRAELVDDLGVSPPGIDHQLDAAIEANQFRVDLQDVPVAEGEIPADSLMVLGDPTNLDLAAIPYERGAPLIDRGDAIWVNASYKMALEDAGIGFLTPAQVLGQCLGKVLRRYAPQFVGIQETRALLGRAEADFGELIREVQNVVPIQKIAEIMRRLVEENIPIRNLRLILEGLVEYAPKEKDVVLLGEYVRLALGRQICFRVADRNRVIAAYVLERSVEDSLRAAIRPTTVGTFLNVPEATARPIINQFRRVLATTKPDVNPAVLSTMDVRRHLRNLLMRNGIDLPVLSYQELTPEFSVQPLATIVAETPAARASSGRIDRREGTEAVR
ncbi:MULTISPECIES: type III secretion system export apparatus subunit SctV [Rhodomicrobium]|uniref:type III secretion system export apparatus subunit SctV n=1 Tax=Rhodomicrobium TaxID=1068 RepID=UPI000B4B3A45|nr:MULTISPECIES: type III secretion system export apparatus subunit SctV [Rhodomicrobium]